MAHRLWELHGLALDPGRSTIQYSDREVKLTGRKFQLLQFLPDRPQRSFSAAQLAARAWSDPGLSPEEIRNYVRRLRKLLSELGVPAELVNLPGRGYSVVIRDED